MSSFTVFKKSKKSNARIGLLKTSHGEIETPSFVPVATQGSVKTLTSEEVRRTGSQLLICNTYHLHIRPGENIVKNRGGLHGFMQWDRPLMTDSGGYQVFSLGFGMEKKSGKVATGNEDVVNEGTKPRLISIDDDGVLFKSYLNGDEIYLTPKKSIEIQKKLGADLIIAFDECPPPQASRGYIIESLRRTHDWAAKSLAAFGHSKSQMLYGVVQGGRFPDLRRESAAVIGAMDFGGFAIGGEFGADKKTMQKTLASTMQTLPEDRPRHLLGIGMLDDIPEIIKAGVDTFDCTVPTHYARHGAAFTAKGKLNLKLTRYLKDAKPLDPTCACEVCAIYSRSFISHLMRAHEITGMRLLTFHNIFYFNQLVAGYRKLIMQGKM